MKYEYKSITTLAEGLFGGVVDNQKFDEELNALGDKGWELVNTFPSNVTYGKTAYIVSIFKRAVQ